MHHRDSVFQIGSFHALVHEGEPQTTKKTTGEKKPTRKPTFRYATRPSLCRQPSIILNAKSSPHPLELLNATPGTSIMLSPTEIALMVTQTTRRKRKTPPRGVDRSTKAIVKKKVRASVQDAIDTRWEMAQRGSSGARQGRYDLRPRPLPVRVRFG